MFTYFLIGAALLLQFRVFSQNQASKWYFGNYAGLDFMTSPPTALSNGALNTNEGTASIADGSGNLLFYTDGVTIWNSSHAVMANGNGLLGHSSTSQSALIVKQPGNTNIYFVFTLDRSGQVNGLCYSVVDMNLAAGMGSVTIKNVEIQSPSTEKLCAVKHCNGIDTWVLSHDYFSNTFRANKVSALGVDTPGVTSSAGSVINQGLSAAGCMKFSPNGKKLGLAIYAPASFELYDFDPSTGMVSNPVYLPIPSQSNKYAYGCEFSPDGTKFYGTQEDYKHVTNPFFAFTSYNFNVYQLYQWDLCAGGASAIAASRKAMAAPEASQMQLAPDGKIYVARTNAEPPQVGNETMIGVIHNPNAAFAAINYVSTGQSVFPNYCINGLPNFVAGFYKTPIAPLTYSINASTSCFKAFFTAPPLSSTACSASSYSVDSLRWYFGEPASGTANTSTLNNPSHTYLAGGVYNAKLILYNQCGGVIDTLRKQVAISQVSLTSSSSSFSLCSGQSLTLTASGLTSYSWSTGASGPSIIISPTATSTSTFTYSVEGPGVNSCQLKTTQEVTVNVTPSVVVNGTTSICTGAPLTLTASGAASYTWNTGALGPLLKLPATIQNYWVKGSVNGCTNIAYYTVTLLPLPQIQVNGVQPLCANSINVQTIALIATGANTYTWNNGPYGTPATFANPATYSLVEDFGYAIEGTDTNNGCVGKTTGTLSLNFVPTINITGNQTVCAGASTTLTANGAATYTWNNGNKSATNKVSPASPTTFTVTGATAAGCKNTATVLVNVEPRPPLSVSSLTVCGQEPVTLVAESGTVTGLKIKWLPGALSGTSINVSLPSTEVFTVIATSAANCVDTTSATLTVLQRPELQISPNTSISPGASATLQVSGGSNYIWSPAVNRSCINCDNPVATPEKDSEYCVTTGTGSCISTACVYVAVTCETDKDFSVPNAFTPNNDGNNDLFCLQGWNECTVSFKILIYDRWGQKVFESSDSSFCWDGVFNGQALNAAVYIYSIQAKKFNGDTIAKKGNITLIR